MKKRHLGGFDGSYDRLERWIAVQLMLPRKGDEEEVKLLPHFAASWEQFLEDLPPKLPMSSSEFAKLAFFAGACSSFAGLAQHDKDSAALKLSEQEDREALEELAMEPLQYLRVRGIKLP